MTHLLGCSPNSEIYYYSSAQYLGLFAAQGRFCLFSCLQALAPEMKYAWCLMNAGEELDYGDIVEQSRGSMDDPLWCSVNIQLLAVHAGETLV